MEDLTSIWSILLPFGIFYGHLVNWLVIWYISHSGMKNQEKSGNPDANFASFVFENRAHYGGRGIAEFFKTNFSAYRKVGA
jgi:hypothetical protein